MRSLRFPTILLSTILMALVSASSSQSQQQKVITPAERTARYLESIRKSPPRMLAFFLKMPKGGDLHSHLSGAIYAESYIRWAAEKGLCLKQDTMSLSQPPCTEGQTPISTALTNTVLYRKIIDSWSMRYWQYAGQNPHDQFFDTFAKFGGGSWGAMLAEVASRAASGNVLYLELMLTPGSDFSNRIGTRAGWDGNPQSTLNNLKTNGISAAATAGLKDLREAEDEKNRLLECGTRDAAPGCAVVIRFVAQVSRGSALPQVYAQMVTGFTLANDPQSKVVALNLVQPEDWLPSMDNFSVQMDMLKFLRPLYPKAHLTLHAGELAPGVVPPEGLGFHVRDSVMKAGAERIGHGVSIMHESLGDSGPFGLMKEMARRNVLVEICLTSNDTILGVKGDQHPLTIYLENGVPVALATDDEGVSRTEMSREFQKAAEEHGLGYEQLKTMARNSLQYAFVQGVSLWADAKRFVPVSQCARERLFGVGRAGTSGEEMSRGCREFLDGSEKASLQWRLEEQFRDFEKMY